MATAPAGQAGPGAPVTAAPAAPSGLDGRKIGLAGLTVVALIVFSLYAAYLASRAEEVMAPEPIVLPEGAAPSPLGLGQRAPDFTLSDMDGTPVKLSDFAGRPVWVNVWASWCAPCRAEMPDLDQVYREMRGSSGGTGTSGAAAVPGDKGLALLMVSIDPEPGAVRSYLTRTKYNLPVLLDPAISISRNYRVMGLPTHYFVGRDGMIKDLAIGGLKPNAMRARLAKIIN